MTPGAAEALAELRSPKTIRERCQAVLQAGLAGRLEHFCLDLERLGEAASLTWRVTREAYPDLRVPVHGRVNHFAVGGRDRVAELCSHLSEPRERARALADLIVTSVLVDAGAGASWRYVEPGTSLEANRSEGLALASYHAFASGLFSSDPARPLQADAAGLARLDRERFERAFQASADNPLLGLEGRAGLLARLGRRLDEAPAAFAGRGRVGGLLDVLVERAEEGRLAAGQILGVVLEALSPIWPSRTRLEGTELGDVWPHPEAGGEGASAGLVPFHKLSQWLSYSLVHPLGVAGVEVTRLDELTGLAEYRNGGLFFDTGVIVARHPGVTRDVHAPGSEVVVEWRALTVTLLDRLAVAVRSLAGLDDRALPLGSVLEGGSWSAGRRLARERRPDGAPPIRVQSDGTLF